MGLACACFLPAQAHSPAGKREATTPRRASVSCKGQPAGVSTRFVRAVIVSGFLVCCGLPALRASTPPGQPDNATIHGSSSRPSQTPHSRLSITPNDVTLSANQTQHFEVDGADGKPVAVHWDVSGLSCSGSACGTIDDSGTYRAPHSIGRSLAVTLEGVLVSDPKHSVLTRIQLAPAAAPSAPAVPVQAAPAPATPVPAPAAAAPVALRLSTRGPLVAYQGGQLTIDAENCTLAAVLQLVAEKTGAVIEVPPGSGLDRIVEHAGPGPANDVLTQLLNGSTFNFIIVDSPQYPDEPVQVLLSVKRGSSDIPVTAPVESAAVAAAAEAAPSDPDAFVPVVVPQPVSATAPPKEQLSPEEVEQMMKDKARQIRENAQQQQQQD